MFLFNTMQDHTSSNTYVINISAYSEFNGDNLVDDIIPKETSNS